MHNVVILLSPQEEERASCFFEEKKEMRQTSVFFFGYFKRDYLFGALESLVALLNDGELDAFALG